MYFLPNTIQVMYFGTCEDVTRDCMYILNVWLVVHAGQANLYMIINIFEYSLFQNSKILSCFLQ